MNDTRSDNDADVDPDLYLTRGEKYLFKMNASGHPFKIRVSDGGSDYNDGVTNNGAATGDIIFEVQMDAPTSLVYQCTLHSGMVGNIYIGDPQNISLPAGLVSSSIQIGSDISGSFTAKTLVSSSAQFTTITAPFTGSFTGSFTGNGSNISLPDQTKIFVWYQGMT